MLSEIVCCMALFPLEKVILLNFLESEIFSYCPLAKVVKANFVLGVWMKSVEYS